MKNLQKISFLLFSFLLFPFLPCSAQSKFGHVDYSEIIKNIPGIDSIQTIITNYTADLQAIGEQMAKEFEEKQSAFEKLTNTPNTSQAVLKIKQDELMAIYKRIQEFSQSAEADIQEKQVELLEPFQNKLLEAIKTIAKKESYNYVFDISTLLFHSQEDDLTDKVKTELGIK
ncbi:MAG: OmpH family outer membrane protein [Lentimicrobiaceae bacterium]|nr:OmpH family outer membrane protein [Lentimicrobiaceae bacterium]